MDPDPQHCHRVLLGIAEKHIAISKETIRAGGAGAASSMLAQGGCDEYIKFSKGGKTSDVFNFLCTGAFLFM
jgi:hypothetical protein